MKGVILGLNPGVRIVDISHNIGSFNIRRASFAMMCSANVFPKGTVHVCVVDPGVGSSRRCLIVDTGHARFVGPDNGVFTLPLSLIEEFRSYVIDVERVKERTRRSISNTFHGRDIFAPVAAFLDLGEPPERFGEEVKGIKRFDIVKSGGTERGVKGTVLFVDGFGNLVTNIPGDCLKAQIGGCLNIRMGGKTFPCISASCYADAEPGQMMVLVGSQSTYEISINQGSASSAIGVIEGDEIEIVSED